MTGYWKRLLKEDYDPARNLILLVIAACLLVVGRKLYYHSIGYGFLLWNLFLALLPYLFSLLYKHFCRKSRFLAYGFGFLWLIFFPNAPYMLTDFIHMSRYSFYGNIINGSLTFRTNFILWYDLLLTSVVIITGLVSGYLSLSLMQKAVDERYSRLKGWLFVAAVSLLSGFAMYLGRFIRLNSWELLTNLRSLLQTVLDCLSAEALKFTLLFGIETLIVYFALYLVEHNHSEQ